MTRHTNIGQKRSYLQAGFDNDHDPKVMNEGNLQAAECSAQPLAQLYSVSLTAGSKKRTREDARLPSGANAISLGSGENHTVMPSHPAASGEEGRDVEDKTSNPSKKNERGDFKAQKRPKDADARKFASERRRLKRHDQRHADTVCFACRETGHAARDCPTAVSFAGGSDAHGGGKRHHNSSVVGICYRCGSRRHNLSNCPKPVDPANPLPFASCFVCSGAGHLAGTCPENKEKGVYPNGGSCKLCRQTTHLAKDCALRKQEVASAKLFVGTGQEAGADEDDFHSFKRRTAEVNRDEKGEDRLKRKQAVKQGAHSGVVRAFGLPPTVKRPKVVTF